MNASNTVIAGDMEGWGIYFDKSLNCLGVTPKLLSNQVLPMTKENIKNIEIKEQKTSISSSSAYKKSLLGGFLFGGAGAVAGAASADQNEIYTIIVYWRDNTKSLIEISGNYYRQLQHDLF